MNGVGVIAVAALATWRLAVALWYEHGPWNAWDRLRYRAGVYLDPPPFWGAQLKCFWCCTAWASLPVALVAWLWWPALVPLALSGAAMLLSGAGRIVWHEMVKGE